MSDKDVKLFNEEIESPNIDSHFVVFPWVFAILFSVFIFIISFSFFVLSVILYFSCLFQMLFSGGLRKELGRIYQLPPNPFWISEEIIK